MRRYCAFAVVVACCLALPVAAETELEVTPGWTDGTFDGSDHQTSGIDVYVSGSEGGDIPAVPPPTPVETPSEGEVKGLGSEMFEVPVAGDTLAGARHARYLLIQYRDGGRQLVTLQDEFAAIERIQAVTDTATIAGAAPALVTTPLTLPWETATPVPAPTEPLSATSGNPILDALRREGHFALYLTFAPKRAEITPAMGPELARVEQLLREHPDLKLVVEGHTDSQGNARENKLLSEQRAINVVNALIQRGIAPLRLKPAGYGAAQPVADNGTEAGRAKNRRVELRLQ